ncbi:P-loop containing nucleoside triphosphate hydrolase protein [Lentinula aciculospora]|uniref:RNA helicase n=1 Tax=Lentinula aciculospora TaxID=153920 RepID=A0A9W9AGK0_9AGAR|nr:P-loop containing nucleoside triphosphate hydrolase protein [Lentinula aciculospora]
MGPVPRERYNAKARQATAGGSKKRRKVKQTTLVGDNAQDADPNALFHTPKTKEEKELDRKEKLRQELTAQSESKWTSKRKKRLEKYIDKKLKKEERVTLFEKLSQSQAQLPSSIHLQSSSTLGTGKSITHQDLLDRQENKEIRRAIEGRSGKRKRHEGLYGIIEADADEDSTEDEKGSSIEAGEMAEHSPKPPAAQSVVGSALARNPDGTVIAPKLRARSQSKKTAFASWKTKTKKATAVESDTSFDSSDSAYDSTDDDEWTGINHQKDNADDDSEEDEEDAGEEQSEEDSDCLEGENTPPKPEKSLGFKDWATKQLNAAKGYDPSPSTQNSPPSASNMAAKPPPAKKQKIGGSNTLEMRGPLGEDLKLPSTSFAQQLYNTPTSPATGNKKASGFSRRFISVSRPDEVQESRLMLPVVAEEQPIMEAVLLNPVVVVCGETGSGKTTQIPQFLYEAGFGSPGSENPGMIGITQPRRVAAMSMASRVAQELLLTSSKVSYQIRYDATVSPTTSIKFMTDGVLLRELATDFLLTKYSVIIIDEAHERSMNTDILIGVLSRVLKLREELWKEGKEGAKPLRVIIMSATLRVSDFASNTTLFSTPPPVINVAARQHPVTVHFNRRTVSDYVTEAIKKTTKIHTRLPPGGILIFLTGQNEIQGVCRKLEVRFGFKAIEERKRQRAARSASRIFGVDNDTLTEPNLRRIGAAQADVEAEDIDLGEKQADDVAFDVDGDEEEDPDALDSDEEGILNEELGIDVDESETPMHVVPLYSLLPSDKQMLVFQPPPHGHRLVVIATNVAETSLTIPNIRYVVDCGRAKERRYDATNGIQTFQVAWISKASAAQRAGRAGRTGPGHCYRLYSSALFEHHFDQFSKPEILRMPIEGIVLQMKGMHIDAVVNFPFPTPPNRINLQKAEKVLQYLGALNKIGQITELGKTMSFFPLSPRFSRMLVSGQQHKCLPYVIAIVSALSVGDPFLHEEALISSAESEGEDEAEELRHLTSASARAKEALRLRRKQFFASQHTHSSLGGFTSDIFRILSVVGAYEYAGGGTQFCASHFVRSKAMEEIHKLRAQISHIFQTNFPGTDAGFVPNLNPPSNLQIKVLRQLLTAAFIDQVAVRRDRIDKSAASGVQYASAQGVAYKALGITEDVFIHPSSVLFKISPPEYLIFNEVVRTSQIWIKGLTVINPVWLSSLGKSSLCTFSKPTKNSAGVPMVIPHFGPDGWELPPIDAEMSSK